jgi:hypothetical protein
MRRRALERRHEAGVAPLWQAAAVHDRRRERASGARALSGCIRETQILYKTLNLPLLGPLLTVNPKWMSLATD